MPGIAVSLEKVIYSAFFGEQKMVSLREISFYIPFWMTELKRETGVKMQTQWTKTKLSLKPMIKSNTRNTKRNRSQAPKISKPVDVSPQNFHQMIFVENV